MLLLNMVRVFPTSRLDLPVFFYTPAYYALNVFFSFFEFISAFPSPVFFCHAFEPGARRLRIYRGRKQ